MRRNVSSAPDVWDASFRSSRRRTVCLWGLLLNLVFRVGLDREIHRPDVDAHRGQHEDDRDPELPVVMRPFPVRLRMIAAGMMSRRTGMMMFRVCHRCLIFRNTCVVVLWSRRFGFKSIRGQGDSVNPVDVHDFNSSTRVATCSELAHGSATTCDRLATHFGLFTRQAPDTRRAHDFTRRYPNHGTEAMRSTSIWFGSAGRCSRRRRFVKFTLGARC